MPLGHSVSYRYKCALLLVIVVNLFLGLMYKLSLTTGMYVRGKTEYIKVQSHPRFQESPGGLGTFPPHPVDKGELL